MKKIIFSVLLIFSLVGCTRTQPEYLISGMGFDYSDSEYTVYFETIIINSENTDQTVKIIKGTGAKIENAVEEIKKQCTQPILLQHCGVIVISEDITRKEFSEICKYCYYNKDITLSAFFIKTDNAQKLFSLKPVSSLCVGYDIMGLIKQNGNSKNRFFEVLNVNDCSALPKISVKDGGLFFENKF